MNYTNHQSIVIVKRESKRKPKTGSAKVGETRVDFARETIASDSDDTTIIDCTFLFVSLKYKTTENSNNYVTPQFE